MRKPLALWISLISLALTVGASLALPLMFPVLGIQTIPVAAWALTVAILTMLVWAAQSWRVAIRGARGDVSISMAIDVATMLLYHPLLAATGSALGTALYHVFGFVGTKGWPPGREHRLGRALVRGVITFAAVALGGWLFRTLRPGEGPLIFREDWIALTAGIAVRLAVRVLFYPLGMAALRPDPVLNQLRHEWNRLPVVPFMLTTTIGGSAALIWQTQPEAIVLLFGPLAATWAATREFSRLNELLATLEDKVADRTARLAQSVRALERRLAESEALHTVDQAMVQAVHPDQILAVIAEESARVTGGTSALVTLVSDDGNHQFVRAAYGAGMKSFVGMELPTENSLTGRVLRTGQPQVSLHPEEDPRINPEMVRAGHWKSVIEAPLRAKDRVLGVLVVATSGEDHFDDQHIRLLSHLASQAGLMLENARLHEKSKEVAILEERNRLARELHDSVTQVLFGLTLNLEAADGLLEKKPERAASLIKRSQEMAAEALAEMRSLIFELRPAALQEKGFAAALANHINLFRRRQGIDVSLALEDEERLPADVEFCLYRVAQEALHNVAKHARATRVMVSFKVQNGWASLTVVDDGLGFDPDQTAGAQSFGMLGMKERLAARGGVLKIVSTPGQGTGLEARIPLGLENGGERQ